jgi:L-threonylcarbamoyladenylate synthase
MKARLISVRANRLPPEILKWIVDLLKNGGVIGYPTETVYGLGGDPTRADVIEKIHALKGISTEKSFLLLVGPGMDIRPYVADVPVTAARLMERFWPGPLTLVFRASSILPSSLTGETGTVALRYSPDPICNALSQVFGKPLISTSANRSGQPPARSAGEVLRYFPEEIDAVLDGGWRQAFSPSTIVDVTQLIPVLLREGPVDAEAIRSLTGSLVVP